MAATSAVAAILNKFDGLTATNFPGAARPDIYLGEAPMYDGGQLRTPMVVLRDKGQVPTWDMEVNAIIEGDFDIEIYYRSLADCDTALDAILWNGSSPNQKSGLAFCTLTVSPPLYTENQALLPGKVVREFVGLDYEGQRVHRVVQTFSLVTYLRGTG